jgi:hypothetical protein
MRIEISLHQANFLGLRGYSPGNAGDNSMKECQDVLGIKSGQNNLNR